MIIKSKQVLAAAGLATLVPAIALAMGSRPKAADEEAANLRIQPVAKLRLAAPSAAGSAVGNRTGEELYNAVCTACHAQGVAGAPLFGNAAAWAPRIATGLEALLQTVKTGKNAMPPKGGSNATEEELTRAIVYMANHSGGKFAEPAAPAAEEKKAP